MSDVIGFKEWANVCEALGQGVSGLILRKGGIHEGKGGFEFKHSAFFFFPTWFHTQNDGLCWSPTEPERFVFPPEAERKSVEIRYYAEMQGLWRITDWQKVQSLQGLHVWGEQVVRERFIYDEESCLNVALVRVYELPEPWAFPYQPSYGGCRSWIKLPPAPSEVAAMRPVLSDTAFQQIQQEVQARLG